MEMIPMVKTKCEVYSRVVGYIRPVSNWNDSKQAEFADRKKFDSSVNAEQQQSVLGKPKC
jgi:ribonucleoside-triphosphate reductase